MVHVLFHAVDSSAYNQTCAASCAEGSSKPYAVTRVTYVRGSELSHNSFSAQVRPAPARAARSSWSWCLTD